MPASVVQARMIFLQDESPEALAEFRAKLKTDRALQEAFNDKFKEILTVSKKALNDQYQIDPVIAQAILAKYNDVPEFQRAVAAAQKELEDFFAQEKGQSS